MSSLLGGTIFFGVMGAAGALSASFWAKKQTGLVQILAVATAFCMWLSYALIYISQINPILHPVRNLKPE